MDELFRGVVQFFHVLCGLMWLGGGFYTILVQMPAVASAPPQARGPVVAQIVPKQLTYVLRLGELTILTGILNIFASGRGREIEQYFGSRWSAAIIIGALMALVLLGLAHGMVKPSARRLLALGPRAGSGDAAAATEAAAIALRLTRLGYVQIALGVLIIVAMVIARFS